MEVFFQGVFEVSKENGLELVEIADGVEVQDVVEATGCEFQVSPNLIAMRSV